MLILVILDGFGIGDNYRGNAINAAYKPNFDKMIIENPTVNLEASGISAGLPNGQMGNSEVGHTNIGAGRVVYQELTSISNQIENQEFFSNNILCNTMKSVSESRGTLHLMGLLSDGGVHSHKSHLYALIDMASKYGIKDLCIHAWLDGRDTPPKSGINYIEECETKLSKFGIGKISTICGRYYSMDRDNRWERVSEAYNAIANAEGKMFTDPQNAVQLMYDKGITDEFIHPMVSEQYKGMSQNDAVICFNFRPDRAREITRCFTDKNLVSINTKRVYPKKYLCFTQYDESISNVEIVFKPRKLKNTFGEYISKKGLRQLRIAETEKYAHVTFFFNGGIEEPYDKEDRILIPSPKVETYDLKPEMSAVEITEKAEEAIEKGNYDVIILNYANCDMVGHTGVFNAAIKAVEIVDLCLGRILSKIRTVGGTAIITSDHGNAEKMYDDLGNPFTSHTTNSVPLSVVNYTCTLKEGGKLSDIAPTMLEILGIDKPDDMEGKSLIV